MQALQKGPVSTWVVGVVGGGGVHPPKQLDRLNHTHIHTKIHVHTHTNPALAHVFEDF